MKVITDWNCKLLPMMRDLICTPEQAKTALELLRVRTGVSRFCMMPEFDMETDSVAAFLIRRDKAMNELSKVLPAEFRIQASACVHLKPELASEPNLRRLRIPKTSYLPILLPPAPEQPWVSTELNRLLYHTDHQILFLSFDLYRFFYPWDMLLRLANLSGTAFQFSFHALKDPQMRDVLKLLIRNNAPILFGTSVNSPGKAAYYDIFDDMKAAEEHFSEYERDVLFYNKRLYRKAILHGSPF